MLARVELISWRVLLDIDKCSYNNLIKVIPTDNLRNKKNLGFYYELKKLIVLINEKWVKVKCVNKWYLFLFNDYFSLYN